MEENQQDLFEQWETLPNELKWVLEEMEYSYNGLNQARKKINKMGYTFESGLDSVPFNLRRIECIS